MKATSASPLYFLQKHHSLTHTTIHRHPHTSLPLIPLETFLSQNPDASDLSPHDLMTARIDAEHAERVQLEAARQDLLKQKQALIQENKKRKEDLRSLDHDLERFIDAAKPIQRLFEREY